MSKKKKTAIDILQEKYFSTGMLYKTDFAEAQEYQKKYLQQMADDAFKLGVEYGKVIKSIQL